MLFWLEVEFNRKQTLTIWKHIWSISSCLDWTFSKLRTPSEDQAEAPPQSVSTSPPMKGILVIYLLLGTQLANTMVHGAIDILFSRNLLIPDDVQVTTDRSDETTSNMEEHLLTAVSKHLSPEQTNEYNSIELEHPSDPITYESEWETFTPEEYQPLLDLELFTAGAHSVGDTTVPDDNSLDDYDHPTEYYQEDFTDDYYPYQSPLEYSDGSEAA